jgi:hypothetical protein
MPPLTAALCRGRARGEHEELEDRAERLPARLPKNVHLQGLLAGSPQQDDFLRRGPSRNPQARAGQGGYAPHLACPRAQHYDGQGSAFLGPCQ